MKSSILTIILAICIVLSFSSCASSFSATHVYSDVAKISTSGAITGEKSLVVAENDNLILSVEPSSAAFELTVKENNFTWYSVPKDLEKDQKAKLAVKNMMRAQLIIECGDMKNHIVSTYNSQTDSAMLNGLTVSANGDNGFVASYNFPSIMVTVPIRYTLNEDYLEAEIVVSEIKEEGDYKVLSAELLSVLGAGSTEEKGYMVVPDGSGAVIEFNNQKTTYNNFSTEIYGSDISLNDKTISGYSKAYMPIFGINKGDNGLLAIISRGEAHATVNASISGKTSSYNTVYPKFTIRNYKTVSIDRHSGVVSNGGNSFIMFDTKPQVLNSVAVRYYPLTKDNASYSGMARRYGKYLFENDGRKENKKTNTPLFLDIYGSINAEQKRLFTTVLKPVALTTFEQAVEIVESLSDGGVENFSIQYKNWSSSGVNDKYTKKYDPLNSLGGKKGLRKLNTLLKTKNSEMYLASDIQKFKSSSNLFGLKGTTRMIDNAVLEISRVRRDNYDFDIESRKYNFIPATSIVDKMQNLIKSVPKEFGISLIDTEVYTDFSNNYSKRQQTATYLKDAAEKIDRNSAAQSPNAFLTSSIDTAFNLGGQYGRYDIEDYGIPFYQIAVSGILSYSFEPINLASDKQNAFLQSLEYGSGLMYTITANNSKIAAETKENALYNCDFSIWKSEILEKYNIINDIYSKIGNRLYAHSRLAKDVFKSDFENGSVVINYTDKVYTYKGVKIEPKNFAVITN